MGLNPAKSDGEFHRVGKTSEKECGWLREPECCAWIIYVCLI